MQQIAITGIGIVNALGIGREQFWQGCRGASSGLRRIKKFDTAGLRSNVAGLVENFRPANFMPARLYRRMSRISKMTVAASIEAVQDSGLVFEDLDLERVGIIMGTAYGASSHVEAFFVSLLEHGPRGAQPLLFPETVPNAPASHVAMYHGITGPNSTFCQNALSGETAIQYACNLLRQKVVDIVLVGGADELSPILYQCYNAVGALNPVTIMEDEAVVAYPGGGLVLGEGAGMLVMERSDFAVARRANIYGVLTAFEVAGGAAAMGHYDVDGTQMLNCMTAACRQGGVTPVDIDHISLSANYSGELDRMEYKTLTAFWGAGPEELRVTPLKYLMGDFGGAGVTRAAAILLSFGHRTPLPTLAAAVLQRTERGEPLVWDTHATAGPRCALMVSATFGGGCSCLLWQAQNEKA